jgi:hypothetical protein
MGMVTEVDVVAVEPTAFTALTATSYGVPGFHEPPVEGPGSWMSVPGPCAGLLNRTHVGDPASAFVVYW